MEKSTPIGVIAGLGLLYAVIFMGDGWGTFFDVGSLIIVMGGTIAALLVGFTLEEMKEVPKGIKAFMGFKQPDLFKYVDEFSELSRVARRDGLLALDRRLSEVEDDFMSFGLQMAVDGIEEEAIEHLMNQKIREDLKEGQFMAKFFTTAGAYCPAFGMLGTLIGLIQMLQNLSDPSQIGAGMATALITTFYGALFANLIFLPMADKKKGQITELVKSREMIQTGVLAIVQGDGPSMIEKRLRLFLTDEAENEGEKEGASTLSKAA
ncbi:MAG: motility protein A [Rhodothermales bacterium]